jgi:hypothetical protein
MTRVLFENVTYNLLSERYGTPQSLLSKEAFAADPSPIWLTIDDRWRRVKDKLLTKVAPGVRAIVCLQETSLEWTMRLVPFFAEHGYAFVYDNFSSRSSGYMGRGNMWLRARKRLPHFPLSPRKLCCRLLEQPGYLRGGGGGGASASKATHLEDELVCELQAHARLSLKSES